MDEIVPVQVHIHPNSWNIVDMVSSVVDRMKGINNMHVIVHTHAIRPIQHTHQGEDKKKV